MTTSRSPRASPTKEKFAEIIESIRTQRKSDSQATAMAVEFLAYTGMRISEAQAATWGGVRDGHIVSPAHRQERRHGKDPAEIPAALALLERMKEVGLPCGQMTR